ncbi:MAG: EFR1 family ferrodoxin [Oscillospiraceae bacterium]|nr:EFR1 family ferrodoxin [Oscillospiraceae bacterium]
MKGAILYFSLTGNTKLACEYISQKTAGIDFEIFNMRDSCPNLSDYQIVGFATFASEFKVAAYVRSFIGNMKMIKDKPAFVFTTYGRDNGCATRVLADMLSDKGFRIVAEHSLNTPENYPPIIRKEHGHVDNPTPEQMASFDRFIKDLADVCKQIDSGLNIKSITIPAELRYRIMSKISSRKMMQSMMGNKQVDKALCIKCGLCAAVCPYGAISASGYPTFDESKCVGCFACYNRCPKKAIFTKDFQQFANYSEPLPQFVEKLK